MNVEKHLFSNSLSQTSLTKRNVMGTQNLMTLSMFVPIVWTAALIFVIFERTMGWIDIFTMTLSELSGVKPNRFPFLIMAISVLLWQVSFMVSTFAAAYKRTGKWDNSTPRNLKEKQSGLPFRAQSAHYNEGEQFAITFVVVLASL